VDIKDEQGHVIAHRRRTPDELADVMNAAVQIPGLNNAWTMPIKTRIDMLATGIKTPVGIKVAGPDLARLERIASDIEAVVKSVPGTLSAFAERTMGGNYVQFKIDRKAIARYGLRMADVQDVLEVALGGMPLTTTVEGLERYGVNLRYSRDFRENLGALREIVIPTPTGAQIPLGQLATVETVQAAMGIKSEAAVPNAWIYVDVKGVDVGTYVQRAMRAVNEAVSNGTVRLPSGYNIYWSGQYEYMLRAKQRLMIVVPLTLLIIVLIIYLNTRSAIKTAIVMLAVPFSLVGAIGVLAILKYNLSVAVWVGIIALAGLDVKRVRPKAMTACVIIAGLAPILWSHGTGADVMKRIATPMVGGVVTSTMMELLVYPAIYFLWRSQKLKIPPVGTNEGIQIVS
jgi:Cu(I)/Ag(I) efflux system membrane protein CusA/SilA